MAHRQFGIHLNKKELKVVRVNSPYWIPGEPDWDFLTPEVNMTLLEIRELAKNKNIVAEPGKLEWK